MNSLKRLVNDHLGISLSSSQESAFMQYENLLLEWNQKFNLTAITKPSDIQLKHFYDSLTCLKVMQDEDASIIDIGCGAGFPGIPLKIVLPDLKLVLMDSVRKKTEFCTAVVAKLGLENVATIHARVEELGKDPGHREKYDWAVARAVATLPVLAEYLLPLVQVGGYALAQKGTNITEEISQAKNAITELGGQISQVFEFKLPLSGEKRSLVVIEKVGSTPARYPRKPGMPSKKPLK